MALVNCPDCGEAVSNEAEVCIHCGRPFVSEIVDEYPERFKILAIVSAGLTIYGSMLTDGGDLSGWLWFVIGVFGLFLSLFEYFCSKYE